jgi:hypothetical protein
MWHCPDCRAFMRQLADIAGQLLAEKAQIDVVEQWLRPVAPVDAIDELVNEQIGRGRKRRL